MLYRIKLKVECHSKIWFEIIGKSIFLITNSTIIYKNFLTIHATSTRSDCLVSEQCLQAYFTWKDKIIDFTWYASTPRSHNFYMYAIHKHWCLYSFIVFKFIYRVIHKSLRDFRPLRYSSRDGHAEGEHINRGRDTPSFCPTLEVLDMLTSEGSWQTFLAHSRQSRPMAPTGLFVSQCTGSHSAGISCTTHELFCP